jgi:hypothetical protein
MGLRGRPSKSGKRNKSGRVERAKIQARDYGNDRVQALRALYYGIRRNPEGKIVDVSDDLIDAPGRLHAVGLLDDHGHEPGLIRDTMRDYGMVYWERNADKAPRCGTYEAFMGGGNGCAPEPPNGKLALKFAVADRALKWMRYEQRCLEKLVCDYWWSDGIAPFADCIIGERLRQLGRDYRSELPGLNDKEMLAGALRATFRLIETGLQIHAQRRAA